MYQINPLCQGKTSIERNDKGKFFPHLSTAGRIFYMERRGNDWYVETTVGDYEHLQQLITRGEREIQDHGLRWWGQ